MRKNTWVINKLSLREHSRSLQVQTFLNKTHHITHERFLAKKNSLYQPCRALSLTNRRFTFLEHKISILSRPKQSSQFSIGLLSSSKTQPCSIRLLLIIVLLFNIKWLIRSPVRSNVQSSRISVRCFAVYLVFSRTDSRRSTIKS